jgi:hypothetical protein
MGDGRGNLFAGRRVRYALGMCPHRLSALGLAALVGCTGPAPERKPVPAAPAAPVVAGERVAAGEPAPALDEVAGEEAGGDEGIGADGGEVAPAEPGEVVAAEPVVPEDYGKLHPPLPAPSPDALKVHAMAGYEVVTVYGRPNLAADKLGYMRIGTRTMVTEKVEGEGCKLGFYGLPAGGFACASKGLVVDREREPPLRHPPPAPRMDQALPYEYGFVRRWNSPMWWRVPTGEELQAMVVQREEREKLRKIELAAKKGAQEEPPLPGAVGVQEPEAAVVPVADELRAELKGVKLPLSPDTPWLERGFFLSLGEKTTEDNKSYYRTARGAYVAASDVSGYEEKDFKGVELGEMTYPFGYTKKETKLIQLTPEGKLMAVKSLDKRVFLDLEEEVDVEGRTYWSTADGMLVRKEHMSVPDLQALPKGLDPWERWIDVSLAKQMLVAYEGVRPVYVTMVSTGRKGSKEEPYDTPTGRWRIYSKHISTTMDGNSASDGNYSIQDVPWTMFFFGSYALHGAFWHRGFGAVRSHGCVNLGPSDARWLFQWTTPFLPEGWHGVNATDESLGSTVIVRA